MRILFIFCFTLLGAVFNPQLYAQNDTVRYEYGELQLLYREFRLKYMATFIYQPELNPQSSRNIKLNDFSVQRKVYNSIPEALNDFSQNYAPDWELIIGTQSNPEHTWLISFIFRRKINNFR